MQKFDIEARALYEVEAESLDKAIDLVVEMLHDDANLGLLPIEILATYVKLSNDAMELFR